MRPESRRGSRRCTRGSLVERTWSWTGSTGGFRRRHKPWKGRHGVSSSRLRSTRDVVCSRTESRGSSVTVTELDRSVHKYQGPRERGKARRSKNDWFIRWIAFIGLDRDAVRSTLFVGQADVLAVLRNAMSYKAPTARGVYHSRRYHGRRGAPTHQGTAELASRVSSCGEQTAEGPHCGSQGCRREVDSALDIRHRLLSEQATLTRKITTAEQAAATLNESRRSPSG